jgi:hypothetical protein
MAWGIAGTCVGILGILLGCYFYFRGKREKKPQVRMKSFNLISQSVVEVKPEKIGITYLGNPIENMTVTNVALWNSGREPIRKEDILSTEPLRILTKEGFRILDAEVVQVNNDTNNLRCQLIEDNEVIIDFDYLEKGDGTVIQVFHTGNKNDDLQFKGKVIGASLAMEKRPLTNKLTSWKYFPFLSLFVVAVVFPLAVITTVTALKNTKHLSVGNLTAGIVLLLIVVLLFAILLYDGWMEVREQTVPSSLDYFGRVQ